MQSIMTFFYNAKTYENLDAKTYAKQYRQYLKIAEKYHRSDVCELYTFRESLADMVVNDDVADEVIATLEASGFNGRRGLDPYEVWLDRWIRNYGVLANHPTYERKQEAKDKLAHYKQVRARIDAANNKEQTAN